MQYASRHAIDVCNIPTNVTIGNTTPTQITPIQHTNKHNHLTQHLYFQQLTTTQFGATSSDHLPVFTTYSHYKKVSWVKFTEETEEKNANISTHCEHSLIASWKQRNTTSKIHVQDAV